MVLKPEMIVGLLLEMATGDENMPKGLWARAGIPTTWRASQRRSQGTVDVSATWRRSRGPFDVRGKRGLTV